MLSAAATPVYATTTSSPTASPVSTPQSSSPPTPHHQQNAGGEIIYQSPVVKNSLVAKVQRSDSLRSETSDQSSSAENRRVSFNSDVTVKKIPKSKLIGHSGNLINAASRPTFSTFKPDDVEGGPFARNVTKEQPPSSAQAIATEAELILRHLEGVECSTSPTPRQQPLKPPTPASRSSANTTASSASNGGGSGNARPLQPPPIQPKPKFVLSSFRGGGLAPPTQNKFIAAAAPVTAARSGAGGGSGYAAPTANPNVSQATSEGNVVDGVGVNGGGGGEFSSTVSNSSSSGVSSGSGGAVSASQINNGGNGRASGGGGGGGVANHPAAVDSGGFSPGGSSSDSTKNLKENKLYGLHALNNLDIAVNGKDVNAMPSYQEVRRRNHGNLDSSGGSAEYSPPQPRRNGNMVSPPKPPRKAPSQSPPSMRREAHYAHPVPADTRSSKMVSSMMEQLSQDSRFRRRLAETSGDDDLSSSYTSPPARPARRTSPAAHPHQPSPTRRAPPPIPMPAQSRASPTRTCMTDTELLRSPSEVLYAVSDKHSSRAGPGGANDRVSHSTASQTMQSELQQRAVAAAAAGGGNQYYDHRKGRSRASSREDLLYGDGSRSHYAMSSASQYGVDDDKENAFKTRIHVTSPDRLHAEGARNGGSRKPYKTTINTATDNIQYRGADANAGKLYQKNQLYRRPESEHYKVPKNKAPVEYLRNGGMRPLATDSDHSSIANYYGGHHQQWAGVGNGNGPSGGGAGGRQQFASTRLVKNVETRRHGTRELDREGRTILRKSAAEGGGRGRTYSGCSTSPDREGSPDVRYSRPSNKAGPMVRSYSNMHRSPSTSPTRPPRSRSSPGREVMTANGVRRVVRTPSNRAATTSRSPIKEIRRVQNDVRHHNMSRTMPRQGYDVDHVMDDSEERFSRFTEYRGGNGVAPDRRDASYDNHMRPPSRQFRSEDEASRERGRSLPPGANIDSMRDFYKSSQYKSMYALPPSPSRPAPVLERAPSSSTLMRQPPPPRPVRPTRVSISEGEITDDAMRQQQQQQVSNFITFLNDAI